MGQGRRPAQEYQQAVPFADLQLRPRVRRSDDGSVWMCLKELRLSLPAEDVYLVEAYLSAGADTLVTTDQGLHEALADSVGGFMPTARRIPERV